MQQKNSLMIYPIGKFKDIYINKKEYETIKNIGFNINIIDAWHYFDKEPEYPFLFLKDFYDLKEKLKKEKNQELSWIPKIILNGFYGKTIQMNKSLIYTKEFKGNENLMDMILIKDTYIYEYQKFISGKLFNPIVANEITANTRNKLFQSCFKYQNNIIGFQTDSIITDKKIPLNIGENLGDWEIEKEDKRMIILGSGIYQTIEDEQPKIKFRGFGKQINIYDMLKNNNLSIDIKKNYKFKSVMKLRMNEHKKLELLNQILPDKKIINLNFDKKRLWDRDFKNSEDVLKNKIESKPISF